MSIDFSWEVEDGYAGASRPQSTSVEESDFEDMEADEIKVQIREQIDDEFNSSISWHCDVDAVVEEIMAALKD